TSAYSSPAKSLGDPGITPLSPSHTVKDSDADDAVEQLFLVVVAIDFGTTSSGYAYSFTKEPECIHVMRRWEGGDPGVSNQKTPTTILLTPERKFHSFGYAARDYYHDLDPTESKHWLYFEKFKMKLHTTGNLTMETDLTAANGKKVKALEIFAYALQFFKEQALKVGDHSDQGGSDFENTEVRWVITVPAIWKQPAKQFMRQAAYKAGMASPENPEQLIIALEPEAASIYCRKLRLHQMIDLSSRAPVNGYSPSDTIGTGFPQGKEHVRRNRQSRTFMVENVIGEIWSELEEGDRYIVVDSGGGTVDMTVHQIRLPEGHLKELYKATGGPYGSLGVDYEFEKLLCKIFGEDFIEQFKIKRPAAWVDLMIAFESRKRAAAPDRTNPLNITLPFSFIDYYKKFRGHSVEHALRKSNVDFVKWSSQGMLRMSPDAMNALFKPTIDQIIQHLSEVFDKPEVTNVKFLFLVGGFAESPLLQQAVQSAFGSRCRVIIPQDVGLTILKGAVLFGLDPAVIKVRRSPLTYGVGVLNRFVEGKHPPEKLLVKDGTRWCTDVFDKFISADQSVALGETVTRSYTPAKPSQLVIVINIYSSEQDNVSFITEPGVKKCGTLRLDLTGTDASVPSRREIKTLMQFGDTEIKAMAVDVATSKSVKVGIDFLNY
ncbi:HS12A protein, partial [Struthidea cinerea]|nr:HS12A protein [Struthidea cinerea]